MKMLSIEEQTYKRLESIMDDIMHMKERNVSYDDVINELIDVYQDRLALSGENAWGIGKPKLQRCIQAENIRILFASILVLAIVLSSFIVRAFVCLMIL